MGFEDNKDALGFEGEQLDLDSDADLTMGTGTAVKAQRKKGIKTEEVAFAKPKRDRFGRRGDGEEAGEGADMLNPDKPTRIAGGFSRREMTPQEVKPLHSENSKFAYLFSADEEDEDEVSTVEGKKSAVEALAMKGDEANAGNVFERETRSVIHSQGKPQRRREETEEAKKPVENTSRFSRRSEQKEQQTAASGSRFARRSAVKEAPAEPVKEEPAVKAEPVIEVPVVNEPTKAESAAAVTEPVAEPVIEENTQEQTADSAVYADSQIYGYGNPYMYGQYQQPYSPYGGYPPQNPYMQPYGQPYPPYGQPPYPYQYPPAGYAQPQPQYIPVGYVFQAGFVPVELAHNTPQRRKRRPSAARSAYRYDQTPYEEYEEEQPVQIQRVRAIAAKSEPVPEQPAPIPEPVPTPVPAPVTVQEEKVEEKPVAAEPVKEEKPAYESQYERIVSEIPQRPVQEEKTVVTEAVTEEKTESNTPARFARRGASQPAQTQPQSERYIGENTGHSRFAARGSAQPAQNERPTENAVSASSSRFAARGSASRSAQPAEASVPDTAASAPSGGGRFNRRG